MRSLFKLIMFVAFAGVTGCSSGSDSSLNSSSNGDHGGNGIPSGASAGEMSFSVNGTKVFRAAHSPAGTRAIATLNPSRVILAPKGSLELEIVLDLSSTAGTGLPNMVQLYVTLLHPDTGMYYVVGSQDSLGLVAYFRYYGAAKIGAPGGYLHIVKFDTANSVISGTFSMKVRQAVPLAPLEDTITSGYFKDLPILSGMYHPGTISATANGRSFVTPDSVEAFAEAYMFAADSIMYVTAVAISREANGDAVNHTLHLQIINARTGTFQIGKAPGNVTATYSLEPGALSSDTKRDATGSLTITKFDTVSHRMDGTFQFSGRDYSTSTQIVVSNGSINNLHFFQY
jgi:hypothetical protein